MVNMSALREQVFSCTINRHPFRIRAGFRLPAKNGLAEKYPAVLVEMNR